MFLPSAFASPGVLKMMGPPNIRCEWVYARDDQRISDLTFLIKLPGVPKPLLERAKGWVIMVDELVEKEGRVVGR